MSSGSGQSGSQTSNGGSDQSGSGSSSAGPTSTTVVSPDQVAADQATLDADEADLSEDQTSLDEAQLTTPIAGTVASVGVTAGQSVSANSSSDQIVVIAPEQFEVSTTVAVTEVSQVKMGDKASVTLNGQDTSLVGQVTEIGPPPTSSSTTDYPVVISLSPGLVGLYDGASASVSIVVDQASDVVTVPTSAVHELGRFAYVSEVRDGTIRNVDVTVGVVGNTLTQVSSGVKAGVIVVLANLSEPLPSTSSTSGGANFAGVGALTGTGGFGGGGFRRAGGTSAAG
jgi:HlyD family secretion protein